MPESSYHHPLFGEVRFSTKHEDRWVRGDRIMFISGFNEQDVPLLFVPQLLNIPGTKEGEIRFHVRGHAQLLAAFAMIESEGLLRHVKTCAGTWNKRLRKPTSGATSKLPSNHAFGIAINLNEEDPGFGDSVAPVAPIFESFGFT